MPFTCIDFYPPSSGCHRQIPEHPTLFIKQYGTQLASILFPLPSSSPAIIQGDFNGHVNILNIFCIPLQPRTPMVTPWTLSSPGTTQTSLLHILITYNSFTQVFPRYGFSDFFGTPQSITLLHSPVQFRFSDPSSQPFARILNFLARCPSILST